GLAQALDGAGPVHEPMRRAVDRCHPALADHVFDLVAPPDRGSNPWILDLDQRRAVEEASPAVARVLEITLRAGLHPAAISCAPRSRVSRGIESGAPTAAADFLERLLDVLKPERGVSGTAMRIGSNKPERQASPTAPKIEVPKPSTDRPQLGRVGIIAVVGFVIGMIWPRLAGVKLVPNAPTDEEAARVSGETSSDPSAE